MRRRARENAARTPGIDDLGPKTQARVHIDVQTCTHCGGSVKVIACIEDPAVIKKILTHLQKKGIPDPATLLPQCRAPPQTDWVD